MPSLSNIPVSNNVTAVAIKTELGYANSAGYLDMNGAVRYLQPGPGRTINSASGSQIAFTDLAGAYLRDFEAYHPNIDFVAVGVDSSSNIITASNVIGPPDSLTVSKFTAAGNSVWSKSISNSTIGIQSGGRIICDWADNIYLKVLSGNNSSSNSSLISLDANGSIRWSAQEDQGNPLPATNAFSFGNSLHFVNEAAAQLKVSSGAVLKHYNTNNGTVNLHTTVTSGVLSGLEIYDTARPYTSYCGSLIVGGNRRCFVRTQNIFVYHSGTDIFPYGNDMVSIIDPYYNGTATSGGQGTVSTALLTSCAPPYVANPKTAATTTKISLLIQRDDTVGQLYAWSIDYGATRNVIGYKVVPTLSYYIRPNTISYLITDNYHLIIGYIAGAYTSSIFITAYSSYNGDDFSPPTVRQTFPWSYEIGSSDSSHDYEIMGPPTSYTIATKERVVIPVKVSRNGVIVRKGFLSLSLPNITQTGGSDTLSVTNEGEFPGVSVYPLSPTVTLIPEGSITPTQVAVTETTVNGLQNTGNASFVASSSETVSMNFNFLN